MIKILHKLTGHTLATVDADTLARANLSEADLRDVNLCRADLHEANLHGADLRGADLHEANLRDANLRDANLRGADLRGANLIWTNLSEADLGEANLSWANLREANLNMANLWGAHLDGADLRGANLCARGNMREIRTMQIDKWAIGYTFDTLQIGCQRHPISEWKRWNTPAGRKWVAKMDCNALPWADKHLAAILALIDAAPATTSPRKNEESK